MSVRQQIKKIKTDIANAQDYKTWFELATELDKLEGNDIWQNQDESPYYDHEIIKQHIELMREYRQPLFIKSLIVLLEESLYRHWINLSNPELYLRAHAGTKHIVTKYFDAFNSSLKYLCDTELKNLSDSDKLGIFKNAERTFGKPALTLSGGAVWGLFHGGVVKAIFEQGLLPQVISGTSMGSFIAGVACTHTDEELLTLSKNMDSLYVDALRLLNPEEMWSQKAIMDQDQLLDCMRNNMPDITFKEAYEKTGRILNITVSPARSGQTPRILNYLTSPHVLIPYSAVCSCAIPGIFTPGKLISKTKTGKLVPYMANEKWIDGAVYSDIPIRRLSRLHNVNCFIVSQTNPHVIPFTKIRSSSGFLSYLLDMGISLTNMQFMEFLNVTRNHVHAMPWRSWLDQIYSMLDQKYIGDINIQPPIKPIRYLFMLSNPNHIKLKEYILEGERATWPKISMIKEITSISKTLTECIDSLEKRLKKNVPL